MREDAILYLSQKDVKKCLGMKDAMEATEDGIRSLSQGKAIQPPKVYMEIPKYHGYVLTLTAFVDEPLNIADVKIVSYNPESKKHGGSTILSKIVLIDPKTGLPLAIMDGTWITAVRTAATTAVAAKYLAKRNSEVVGILGVGIQARTHLMALKEIFKLKRVRVTSVSKEHRVQFAKEVGEGLGLDIVPVDNCEQAMKGADIVLTLTTANEALVKKEWVAPGMFIAKIGSYQELDFGVPAMVDKLVVDSWESVRDRVREIIETNTKREDIYAELGDIILGRKGGRESDIETVLFVATGMGVEDAAVALRAYQYAKGIGIGQVLEA